MVHPFTQKESQGMPYNTRRQVYQVSELYQHIPRYIQNMFGRTVKCIYDKQEDYDRVIRYHDQDSEQDNLTYNDRNFDKDNQDKIRNNNPNNNQNKNIHENQNQNDETDSKNETAEEDPKPQQQHEKEHIPKGTKKQQT